MSWLSLMGHPSPQRNNNTQTSRLSDVVCWSVYYNALYNSMSSIAISVWGRVL